MNILIRLPNWLGDMVMSTAFVRTLQQAMPDAQIDVIAKKGIHPVAEYLPGIRHIHMFAKEDWPGLKGAWRFGKSLSANQYDWLFCLPESFSSAVMAVGTGAKKRIGFGKELRSFMLTHAVNKPQGLHRAEEYLHLLPPAGIAINPKPAVYLENRSKLHPNRLIVNVNSEAESRRLPVKKAIAILDLLREKLDQEIMLVGSPKELPHVLAVIAGMKNTDGVINMAGKTDLHGLMQTLGSASVMLTTDSGPMHLANALGAYTVALEGASDEKNTAPFNADRRALIRYGKLACEPCVKNICQYGEPKCLLSMDEWEILAAVKTAFSKTSG